MLLQFAINVCFYFLNVHQYVYTCLIFTQNTTSRKIQITKNLKKEGLLQVVDVKIRQNA